MPEDREAASPKESNAPVAGIMVQTAAPPHHEDCIVQCLLVQKIQCASPADRAQSIAISSPLPDSVM
jgi:hypothetical protein